MKNRKSFIEAIQEAHYNGERIVLESGEIKAAIVPIEDLEILEGMDAIDLEIVSPENCLI
jgi:hypothetical protein